MKENQVAGSRALGHLLHWAHCHGLLCYALPPSGHLGAQGMASIFILIPKYSHHPCCCWRSFRAAFLPLQTY